MSTISQDVLSLYQECPLSVRFHVALRWRLFPFPRLAAFVPNDGLLVDLGCGHGLWSFYLALLRPSCQVLGFDPDEAKVALAEQVSRAIPNRKVRFAVGLAEVADYPPCNLVSLIDVLYLLQPEAQVLVLEKVVDRLQPGGRLLLKVMNSKPTWKYAWNYLEEWLAVRVFGITYGRHLHFRTRKSWQDVLRQLGLQVQMFPLDRGYLHPHLLFVADKPA